MLARQVGIESLAIAINLPQRKDVRLFGAPTDVELEYAGLLTRRVAQLPE
jgi:hypothetical protein